MPQLDITAFFSIVLYVYLFFFILLTYITLYVLPIVKCKLTLKNLLKNRNV